MYQYIFEDKYVSEHTEPGYVRSELLHKRHTNPLHSSNILLKLFAEGSLLLVGYLLGANYWLMLAALAILLVTVVLRLKHKRQTKFKESLLLKENIVDIGYTLKHKRQELYRNPHGQVEYKQSHFKGDARVFLLET
jgi:hypothetical protein